MIDQNVVSFQLNAIGSSSYAIFGSTPSYFYTGKVTFIDVDKRYNQWWTVTLSNVYYNKKSVHTSGVNHAIISSGTPMILMPKTDFVNFKTALLASGPLAENNITCPRFTFFTPYCFSNVPCSNFTDVLFNLEFDIGGMTFNIPPLGYMVDNYNGHTCAFMVSFIQDSDNMYVLGDAFMRNFFTSFDMQNSQIMLAVNENFQIGQSIGNG